MMKVVTLPLLGLIKIWQKFIAPGLAPRCKYYPSCSQYTYEAIKGFNLIGVAMGAWRVIRCNPFSHGGVDYVPNQINLFGIKIQNQSTTTLSTISTKGAR